MLNLYPGEQNPAAEVLRLTSGNGLPYTRPFDPLDNHLVSSAGVQPSSAVLTLKFLYDQKQQQLAPSKANELLDDDDDCPNERSFRPDFSVYTVKPRVIEEIKAAHVQLEPTPPLMSNPV